MRLAIKISLALFTFTTLAQADSWSDGLNQYQKGGFELAEKSFSATRDEEKKSGSESAAVMHNLALTAWKKHDFAAATGYFAKSIDLTNSWVTLWKEIDTLDNVQKALGLQENVAEYFSFQLSHFLNLNVLWVIISLGFWSTLFGVGLFFLKFRTGVALPISLLSVGVVFGLIGIVGFINHRLSPAYGVLAGAEEEAILYRTAEMVPSNVLGKIPRGILVELRGEGKGEKGNSVLVGGPVAGWVDATLITPIDSL